MSRDLQFESVLVSVVVPAYNESDYLGATLSSLRRASAVLQRNGCKTEVIVVDDGSTDSTNAIAAQFADRVVRGPHSGIGRARNLGAAVARGSLLVFVDADTIVQKSALLAVYESWVSGVRAGAVAPVYRSKRFALRIYLAFWQWYATRRRMTQGVCQFFDRSLFEELGGYRDDLFMAEDTDLNQRALKLLEPHGQTAHQVISSSQVRPSMRREEHWSVFRVILWTNPWTTKYRRDSRRFWRHWYDNPPR